ncbi:MULTISPECIES: hypothetical protein [unclassified Polaromonas]|uniref:hypothetical protein n=1 Tax=unclassified Polaromonas TaxID=2638319 RepID=UPI0018CB21CD|nr:MULTISPECIES: hypothetical protein [unclassified Polaromonas]MBG6073480.1 hypothetical protein [Polaromonas sp. CG_9.7]MBG6115474.1 hypothetical protein [Polaromonas sp. CG_9.2]MDH6183284.1 hypothetical protein [Polaromonas sp. CG_23.6]
MNKLMTVAGLAAFFLSGCAAPGFSASNAGSTAAPAPTNLSLEGQSRVIRSKIVALKKEVMVFEVMLTDVERRAAMSQISLSSFPNTEVVQGASVAAEPVPARSAADRLSVTVRPAPASASPSPSRPVENSYGKVP